MQTLARPIFQRSFFDWDTSAKVAEIPKNPEAAMVCGPGELASAYPAKHMKPFDGGFRFQPVLRV